VEAKLSSVIHNGDWFWRPARFEGLVDIQARLPEINLGFVDNVRILYKLKLININ
jgi:hypothetical protein